MHTNSDNHNTIELTIGDSLMLVTKHEVLVCTITSVRPRAQQAQRAQHDDQATIELITTARVPK